MHVSAKADYAVRAAIEPAAAGPGPVRGDRIAEAQQIPPKLLENILSDLRHAGYVQSQRGAEGGYWLAEPADAITLADIIRAVDSPLANVRGAGRSRSSTRAAPATWPRSGSRSGSACAACWSGSPWPTWSPGRCRPGSRS
jgi:Rrf2 family protein